MILETFSRRRILQAIGATGVATWLGLSTASGGNAQGRAPLDRHLVGIEPGRADVARERADEVYRILDFGDIGQAVSGWYPDDALEGLRNNPNVRYIEAEGEMAIIDHTVEDGAGDPSEVQVLPWGIGRVGADAAHHAGETGSGASIAIIDTGIDPTTRRSPSPVGMPSLTAMAIARPTGTTTTATVPTVPGPQAPATTASASSARAPRRTSTP